MTYKDPAKRKAHHRRYRAEHAEYREKEAEQCRLYRQLHPRDPELRRLYRANHLEQCRAYDRAYVRGPRTDTGYTDSDRKWYKAHGAEAACRRRSIKAGCIGSHTEQEWQNLVARTPVCPADGLPWSENHMPTRDHVVPIGPGVSNAIDNIEAVCGPGNSSKCNRSRPISWLPRVY